MSVDFCGLERHMMINLTSFGWDFMAWLRDLLKIKPSKRAVYTLDRDGGLVVSRTVILRSGIMKRQFNAASDLYETLKVKKAVSK